MGQPGKFAPPGGEDWIGRKFAELERQFRELAAANPYAPMGMTPMEGGVEFNGNMKVAGTLELPAGIIGNDALTDPISATVVNAGTSGFGLATGTLVQKLSRTVTVPPGFTSAQVTAFTDMTARNSTASGDYCFIIVDIDGVRPTYSTGTFTAAGEYSYCGSNFATSLSGLGPSFTISVLANSQAGAWTANPDTNIINLNAAVTFLR